MFFIENLEKKVDESEKKVDNKCYVLIGDKTHEKTNKAM